MSWKGEISSLVRCDPNRNAFDRSLGMLITDPFRANAVRTVLTGTNGGRYEINGRMKASSQIQCFPNMTGNFALMEWDCNGKGIGYGDIQMCTWSDAYKLMDKFAPGR